jgi:hypothetical protein
MRVKLIIALAIASIFLLAGSLPALAVEGNIGTNSFNSLVNTPVFVAPVIPTTVVPCVSLPAPLAPGANTLTANTINLAGPALQTQFTLFAPQSPSFSPPNFVLQTLTPPSINQFIVTPAIFDP